MRDKKILYYKYFEENILPVIHPIENYRKKTVIRLIVFTLLFGITGMVFAVLFIYNAVNSVFNPLILPVLLFLMYVYILKSIVGAIIAGKEYHKKLIKEVLPLFLPAVANFKPWPKNNDTEAVINSKLFANFDTQDDVASFFGFYKDTNIILSDTRLTLPVKGAVKQNLFKGTTIQFELNKSIDNHVILLSKNEHVCNKYKRIKSGIIDFDKEMFMFAKNSNGLEFLNRDLWNVIKRMAERYTAKGVGLSYRDNVVFIAIRQKNPMQFGFLFKSLLKAKNYDDLIEKFIVIFDLLDLLV